jgi:quercetin dioxygenase-like cupin family protein
MRHVLLCAVAVTVGVSGCAADPQAVGEIQSAISTVVPFYGPSFLAELPKIDKNKDGVDLYSLKLDAEPGDTGGWHIHPGIEIIAVVAGELTIEYACGRSESFGPGTAGGVFAAGAVHRAVFRGAENTTIYVTAIVEHGQPRAIPVAPPTCD